MLRQRISFALAISFLTIVFFQYCYMKCEETVEGPLLVLDEVSFDFGEAEEGAVLTHVFNFNNCGNDTLRIKRVRGT
jgi:hypothetical protein